MQDQCAATTAAVEPESLPHQMQTPAVQQAQEAKEEKVAARQAQAKAVTKPVAAHAREQRCPMRWPIGYA